MFISSLYPVPGIKVVGTLKFIFYVKWDFLSSRCCCLCRCCSVFNGSGVEAGSYLEKRPFSGMGIVLAIEMKGTVASTIRIVTPF